MKKILLTIMSAWFASYAVAEASTELSNFIFIGGNYDHIDAYAKQIKIGSVDGVQIIYSWKLLEPKKDQYNFAPIETNLQYLAKFHKKLYIQLQDRSFVQQFKSVPDYLLTAEYNNGASQQIDRIDGKIVGSGWVAKQWNDKVRQRYQKLLIELAKKFDGRVEIIGFPETAIDVADSSFSCDKYFLATQENMIFAKSVFHTTKVVQSINFLPCEWNNDHNYMARLFSTAVAYKVGVGNPDLVPYNKHQMANSYPFLNKYGSQLPLVVASFQKPDLKYKNPKTKKFYTQSEFREFAKNYLHASILIVEVD